MFEISVTCFSSTWRYTNIFPYFFPVVFQTTTFEISVTCFSSTWHYKNIFPYFFPVLFQTQRLKYPLVAFLVHDVIKYFPVLFPVMFETTMFEIFVSWFSSTWRYKNIFPYFFSVLFSNHNVWNISSLLF